MASQSDLKETITYQWTGKVVLVAGASKGIGREVAIHFAMGGARVFLVARDATKLRQTQLAIEALGGQSSCLPTDLTSTQAIEKMLKQLGEETDVIDIVVNAVGGFIKFARFEEISEAEWDEVNGLNLKSAFMLSQKILPFLKASRAGRMIHVASIAGLGPNPHAPSYLPYGVAKGGLITLVKYLAKVLGEFGITVNAVSPGTTATERVTKLRGREGLEQLAKANPLQHVLEPQDTCQAILFLASSQAKAITGINLNVNAGSVM